MKSKVFHYSSRAIMAICLVGAALHIKRNRRMLICSPMMDDGIASPIMDYVKNHPDVVITKELGEQILRGSYEGGDRK